MRSAHYCTTEEIVLSSVFSSKTLVKPLRGRSGLKKFNASIYIIFPFVNPLTPTHPVPPCPFDKIDRILLCELPKLGASTTMIELIQSYLFQRRVCVKIGSHTSWFENRSGVPQGSTTHRSRSMLYSRIWLTVYGYTNC